MSNCSGEFYKERPVVIYEYQKGRITKSRWSFTGTTKEFWSRTVWSSIICWTKTAGSDKRKLLGTCKKSFADAVKAADKKNPCQ